MPQTHGSGTAHVTKRRSCCDVMEPRAEMLAAVRELTGEIRALRVTLERKAGAARSVSAKDREALSALLPIVHAATLGRSFTLRELVEHAQVPLPAAVAPRGTLAVTTLEGSAGSSVAALTIKSRGIASPQLKAPIPECGG